MRGFINRLMRSPLVHFLLIGATIYLAFAAFGDQAPADSSNTLRVSAGEIAWLEESWSKRWNRPPTAAERQGLIDDYIRETVLYREALAMGLDKDDVIIRRRLSQKLEFLFQDLADASPPTEEELENYFAANAEKYREPEVLTFTHVFVDPDRRGDKTLTDAKEILAKLAALADATEGGDLGDPFMLQRYYPQRSELEVSKLFGQEFARKIFGLSTGEWHGPVLSGYGVHLVYVHDRSQAPSPSFESVRDRVLEDWQTRKRAEFNEEYIAGLLSRYEVIIEDDAPGKVVAEP